MMLERIASQASSRVRLSTATRDIEVRRSSPVCMPALIVNPNFGFIGKAWSPWPPDSIQGLNILEGTRKIAHDIISVCLIRKGEDPQHPTFGMAPNLFDPLSSYIPEYWRYQAEQEIARTLKESIASLRVRILDSEDYRNQLKAEILFVPKETPDAGTLTFGYLEYKGAIWDGEFDAFVRSVNLNDSPFFGLTP